MTVYVEYVLINNFIIDYLMLKATFVLTGITPSRRRLLFCAFLGAVVALSYPLLCQIKILEFLYKLFSGLLIVLLSSKRWTLRSYFINTAVFFCYTFLLGGAITGVFNLLSISTDYEFLSAFIAAIVYVFYRAFGSIVNYIYRQKEIRSLIYDVEIQIAQKREKCKGFLDTGNLVYYQNRPVVVCDVSFAKRFIGENFNKIKLKKIYLSTVNGSSENIAIDVDEIVIYISDKPNIFKNVTLAVAAGSVGDGYDLILHPFLIKEYDNEKGNVMVEKVS